MNKNQNSALEPFVNQLNALDDKKEKESYSKQFQDFLLRYYIGISDLRTKGPLIDCGLPHRIEKYLSLYGKVLAIELTKDKIYLARLVGDLERNLDKSINKCDFILIDDGNQEKYQVCTVETEEEDENGCKIKKLAVYDGKGEEDISIDPKKIVLFLNNDAGLQDQIGIELWLEWQWETLTNIRYDRRKCRKKMAVLTRTKMDGIDKKEAIEQFENDDYIFNISFENSGKGKGKKAGIDPSETNYQLSGPEDSKERSQLWQDYREYKIEACLLHGLVTQPSFKQERQNIPETLMASSPYRAWEKERKQVREEAYRQCEKLGWIEEGWELNYGAQSETNEQKIQKLEEELKIAELEEKVANIKKNKKLTTEEKVKNKAEVIYDEK